MFSTCSFAVDTGLPKNSHQAISFHLQVLNQLMRLRESSIEIQKKAISCSRSDR